MYVHLSSLRPGQKQDYRGDINQLLKLGLPFSLKSMDFELSLEKKGDFVEVDGHIKAVVELECVRCLSGFEYIIDEDFRTFLYNSKEESKKDRELCQDDLEFSAIDGDRLEIAEILREQLLLKLPDYPKCNAACQVIST